MVPVRSTGDADKLCVRLDGVLLAHVVSPYSASDLISLSFREARDQETAQYRDMIDISQYLAKSLVRKGGTLLKLLNSINLLTEASFFC